MARVAILHAYFSILGGGEYLGLNLALALKKRHDVTIYTVTKPDADMIKRLFNIDIGQFRVVVREEYEFMRFIRGRFIRLKRLVSYHRLFTRLTDELSGYDFVIDTQSNMPSPVDLAYIHFPVVAEAFSGSPKGVYDWLVKLLFRRWFGRSMSARIACNSRFTARAVYRYYHVLPDVIYPPVDTGYFFTEDSIGDKRKHVVTLSRFTPEKRLEEIPRIANVIRDYTFFMIGFADEAGMRIVDRILDINSYNVRVFTNTSRKVVRDIMRQAMIYLHPPFSEHFGIAVVEAMSAGLVPIVYRDSGTCEDIVSKIDPRLCYSSIDEVPRIIRYVEKHYDDLRMKSLRVSVQFDKSVFQKKILSYVENFMRIKGVI